MHHQIIQHNKFSLNKYFLIENHVQEEMTARKLYTLIQCCDKLKQIKNNVFGNVEVRYIF